MDRRGGIGKDNRLPWRLSSDLKRFKGLTMGHHIIVGRKTFESIGKPLPGRQTIVITRDINRGDAYEQQGCFVAHSVDAAISLAHDRGETEAFVCGGAEVYEQALPITDRMYITKVDSEVEADTFFPEFDRSQWIQTETKTHAADEKNQYAISFWLLERRP